MSRYAVNLGDLVRPENRIVASAMIAPVQGGTVEVDRQRVDGVAVLLNCDDERAQAIVDVIRLKRRKHELRCYVRKTDTAKTWKSI